MGVVEYSWVPGVTLSPLGADEDLLFVRLIQICSVHPEIGDGPLPSGAISSIEYSPSCSKLLLLLLEMGMKLSGLKNLSQSHFSALGVIYQFIVEEIIR